MPQCIHDAYKRTYLSNTIKMKLLIILLTLCNGLIKPSQQGQIDCCMVLVTNLGGSAAVPAACKNMPRICPSSISANKRFTENLDLLKPENDHEPQGEESIITTVSEVWKTRTDTTFSTSTYTTTGSTTVSATLTTTTTNTRLKNTPSGFMEWKSTSFYTYFRCQESLLNHMLPSEICMFHRGQEDFCCICNI